MALSPTGCNLHTHTTRSDGKNSPEEMIEAALARGFYTLGFSDHCFTPGYEQGSMPRDLGAYVAENRALAARYAGRIEVVCGLEVEFDAWTDHPGLQYCIGSRHYILTPNGRFNVDSSPEQFARGVAQLYGGDAMNAVRDYYGHFAADVALRRPDIIGHFDLVRKFNQNGRFFDEGSAAYRRAALEAAEAAGAYGAIFELNTANRARKRRQVFLPAGFILRFLREKGYPVCISADAHKAELIDGCFPRAVQELRAAGFRSVAVWQGGGFTEAGLY